MPLQSQRRAVPVTHRELKWQCSVSSCTATRNALKVSCGDIDVESSVLHQKYNRRTRNMGRGLLYCGIFVLMLACERGPKDPCIDSDACTQEGRCAPLQGRCVAAIDRHCRQSANCELLGQCSLQEGRCRALTMDDCEVHSSLCRTAGQCVPRGGICGATSQTACRQAKGRMMRIDRSWTAVSLCDGLGQCHAVNGQCASKTDTDCSRSLLCKEWGRCRAFKGTCLAQTDNDCRTSRACRENGACVVKSGKCMTP